MMQATAKDLRFHTKEILDAAVRGEDVVITYHGKPYVKILPIQEASASDKTNEFCGMWKDRDDIEDVDATVRNMRKRRVF